MGWFDVTRVGLATKADLNIEGITLPRAQLKKILKLLLPQTVRNKKTGVTTEIPGLLDVLMPVPPDDHADRARVVAVRAMMVEYIEIVRVLCLTTPRSNDPVHDKAEFDNEVFNLRMACTKFSHYFFEQFGSAHLTN